MERCRDENSRLARLKHPVSVIFIDVDHFKQINDTLGQQTGDLTLQTIVQKIGRGLRETWNIYLKRLTKPYTKNAGRNCARVVEIGMGE